MRASDVLAARDRVADVIGSETGAGAELSKSAAEALLSFDLIDVTAGALSGLTVGAPVKVVTGDDSGDGVVVDVDASDDVRPFHVYLSETGTTYWAKPDEVALR